jgi:hypothetical protein
MLAMGLAGVACGGGTPEEAVPPQPSPLPTAGIAGRPVTLYPLTMIAASAALGWDDLLRPREAALHRADSVIGLFLTERAPEVQWVLPDELRRAARRAPGMLGDPDRMGTAMLRGSGVAMVPDPLRSQMRNLTGVAGDRYAAVPAALVYFVGDSGRARAELSMVLVDVRNGLVGWRTIASGEGDDPASALWAALSTLVPDIP